MPQKNNTNKAMPDPDDVDAFRTAMQDVAPLPDSNKAIVKHPKPPPRPRRNHFPAGEMEQSADIFPDLEADGEWSFLRPGVSRQTLRRLRNGYWTVQDSLDLHGLTQDAARQQLVLFLENAVHSGYRCVRIVHGKGLSSADGIPVLKHRIGSWLAQYSVVLAFCQARPGDGGSGAVMVLLRK
ncbi:MAG TPA: Smr/MutS family protein [Nitrosomonas sp.]|nr:Smr/MutS family protein [Nitrosomonas sp.]